MLMLLYLWKCKHQLDIETPTYLNVNRLIALCWSNNGCQRINEPLSILVITFFLFDFRSWLFLEKMRRQILYKTVVNYISVKR